MRKRGRKSSLTLGDMLLLTLCYLRNYQTFPNMGNQFGISESYACKIFHRISDILIRVPGFANRKEPADANLEEIIADVTEQPVERPMRNQKDCYSGKKKRHTAEVRIVITPNPPKIPGVIIGKGRIHDFQLPEDSRLPPYRDVVRIGDAGYQGMRKLCPNSLIPIRKKKNFL